MRERREGAREIDRKMENFKNIHGGIWLYASTSERSLSKCISVRYSRSWFKTHRKWNNFTSSIRKKAFIYINSWSAFDKLLFKEFDEWVCVFRWVYSASNSTVHCITLIYCKITTNDGHSINFSASYQLIARLFFSSFALAHKNTRTHTIHLHKAALWNT